VAARGGDFQRPSPASTARSIEVTVRQGEAELVGILTVHGSEGPSAPREVHATHCQDVTEALAVVSSMALRSDGGASGNAPAHLPPQPALAPAPAAAMSPGAAVPPTPPVLPPRDTRFRVAGLWRDEKLPVPAGQLAINRDYSATLSGGIVIGAIPSLVLPRYDLTLTRTNFITTPQGNNYLIGSVVGVRWSVFGSATRREGEYATRFAGFKAGLFACTPYHFDSEGFVLLGCGGFAVGVADLETKDGMGRVTQTKEVGLGTATLELDAKYNIGSHFHVGLTLGAEAWISKLSAERPDGSQLFRSRIFNGNAQLGAGVHF
jgi:hypothetical protein